MSPFYSRHTERRHALLLCKIRQIIHDYLTSLLKEINSKDQKKLALPMISNYQDSTVFDTNKIKKANEEKRNNKNYRYHSKQLIFPLNIFEKFLKEILSLNPTLYYSLVRCIFRMTIRMSAAWLANHHILSTLNNSYWLWKLCCRICVIIAILCTIARCFVWCFRIFFNCFTFPTLRLYWANAVYRCLICFRWALLYGFGLRRWWCFVLTIL